MQSQDEYGRLRPRGEPPAAAIHVCSLAAMPGVVQATRAGFVVSIINERMMPTTPGEIEIANHLKLMCNDIAEPLPGMVAPHERLVDDLVRFVRRWDCGGALVIHCLAGISRSTAAAYIAQCALNPGVDERTIAGALRCASPTASPNRLLVEIADAHLARCGRMIAAIEAIAGSAEMTEMPMPFWLVGRLRQA